MGERTKDQQRDALRQDKEWTLAILLLASLVDNRLDEVKDVTARLTSYNWRQPDYKLIYDGAKVAAGYDDGDAAYKAFLNYGDKELKKKAQRDAYNTFCKQNAGDAYLLYERERGYARTIETLLQLHRQDLAYQRALDRAADIRDGKIEPWQAFPDDADFQDDDDFSTVNLDFLEEHFSKEPPKLLPWLHECACGVLHAEGGTGKSLVALSCCVALAGGGGAACGIWEPQQAPCKVLLIDAEEMPHFIQKRMKRLIDAQGADKQLVAQNLLVKSLKMKGQAFHLPDEKALYRLCRKIEHEKIKLVVLDNVASLITIKDENNGGLVNAIMRPITDAIQKAGAAVIYVVHASKTWNKAEKDKPKEPNARGSSVWYDLGDTTWGLARPKEITDFFSVQIFNQKQREDARSRPLEVALMPVNGLEQWVRKSVDAKLEILDMHNEGKRNVDIAAALGVSAEYVSRTIKNSEKKSSNCKP